MSTQPFSPLGDTSDLSPLSTDDAPQVQMPQTPPPSNLGQAVSQIPRLNEQGTGASQDDSLVSRSGGSGGSRLLQILSAVAKVGSTAMAGIPDKGRPSFVTGLGEGERAAQAAQANQQAIKFKTFDDQIRAAQLHNQDLAQQAHTQEQQDAHEDHMAKMHANDGDWGIQYDTVANHGDAVLDHLETQTAANGSAVVPPGTHISGDGKTILIPKDTPETQAGQLQQFKAVAPALGMNTPIPNGATKLDPNVATAFYNKLQGYGPNGDPYGADKLPALIASNQAQRDQLAKNGAPQVQLDALDGIVSKQKAQLKADNDALDAAASKASARKIAENKAAQENRAAATEDINATKPQKPQNTDANGNPVWVPGVSADEKKKAELSENVVFNANNIASILHRRPDIVGKVAGRFTTLDQMAGTNDPDITALSQDMHNIAIANVGIHGMRSNDAVHDVEKNILNNFRNGPQAIGGALKSTANSVQTFIDNARPETYKTHSKNGGALRSMIPQQGQ